MDWANERYVRVYTRDTEDDLLLSWEATAVWNALIRKVDRAGVLEAKRGAKSIALVTRIPLDVVERVLPELLADGRLAEHELGYVIRNFIEAQETPQSDRQRATESRGRRRDRGRHAASRDDRDDDASKQNVTIRDGVVTNRDSSVTPGHAASHAVTSGHSDPSEPDQTRPEEETPHAQARDLRTPDPAVAARRATGDAIWQRHQVARQLVAADLGLDVLLLPVTDAGRTELAHRLLEAVQAGEELASVAARCQLVLDRVTAECLRDRTLDWLDGQLWRLDRFDRAYAKAKSPVGQAKGNRAPPRRADVRVGRVEPHAPDEYPDGEVAL